MRFWCTFRVHSWRLSLRKRLPVVESVLEASLPDLVVAEPIDDLLVVRVCVEWGVVCGMWGIASMLSQVDPK